MMLTRRGAFGLAALLGLVERAAQAAPAPPGPACGPWLRGETITGLLDETSAFPPEDWWHGEAVPGHILGFDRASSEAVLGCNRTGAVMARRHIAGGEDQFHAELLLWHRARLPGRPAPAGWDTLENVR